MTPSLRRLFQRIKRLPINNGRAWVSFPRDAGELPAPDFLILDERNRAFLLSAGDIKPPQAEEILQPGLFEISNQTRMIIATQKATAEGLAQFGESVLATPVPRILLFPNLSDPIAEQLALRLEFPSPLLVSGDPDSLADLLERHANDPLEIDDSHALQAAFNLESRIPPAFVPRISSSYSTPNDAIDARHTGYLLDFAQESWVKNDLIPGAEAMSTVTGTPARLITGVAGSGKSLALLYRARLQSQYVTTGKTDASSAPIRRALFIAHNKPLIGDLEWRFNRLDAIIPGNHPQHQLTEFVHFFRWCGSIHFQNKLTLISNKERIARISQLARESFPDSGLPDSFFVDEIGFIADQVDDSASHYGTQERSGRGVALDRSQRRKMHSVYMRYRASLAVNRETDWPFIVRMTWEKVRSGRLKLPRYDTIFVDEAQFFAPVWFALLQACLAPGTGEFVVAADPTQGFLKRRLSWRSVGLNVVGRTARLQKSYRNTPAIQAFARRFYNSRIHEREHLAEETMLPSESCEPAQSTNGSPRLIKHRATQDSILWAANELHASIRSGMPPGAVLVIIENRTNLDALKITLSEKLHPHPVSVLSHEAPAHDSVALTTLNSATGVERPVVIVLGIDAIFEKEADPRLDHRQKAELVRDNTRKIYMSLTRAGEKLLISYQNDKTRALLEGTPAQDCTSSLISSDPHSDSL